MQQTRTLSHFTRIPDALTTIGNKLARIGGNLPEGLWRTHDNWRFAEDFATAMDSRADYIRCDRCGCHWLSGDGNTRIYRHIAGFRKLYVEF
jgi:hypothetical protein